jgi:hypothetical protein
MAVRAVALAALVAFISCLNAADGAETLSGSGIVIGTKGEILTNGIRARSFRSSRATKPAVSEFPEASFTVIVWHVL